MCFHTLGRSVEAAFNFALLMLQNYISNFVITYTSPEDAKKIAERVPAEIKKKHFIMVPEFEQIWPNCRLDVNLETAVIGELLKHGIHVDTKSLYFLSFPIKRTSK